MFKKILSLAIVVALVCALSIALSSCAKVVTSDMTAPPIDEVELKTGKRTEGIVFSMQNFVSKLTGAIPKFIQGYFLKWLGFDANVKVAANQTVINAQTATRFLKYRWHHFILGPAIGSLLYLVVILFLDNDDAEHMAEVENALKAKREAAAAVEA